MIIVACFSVGAQPTRAALSADGEANIHGKSPARTVVHHFNGILALSLPASSVFSTWDKM